MSTKSTYDFKVDRCFSARFWLVPFSAIVFVSILTLAFLQGNVFIVFYRLIFISCVVLVFALLVLVVRISFNPFQKVKFFNDGLALIDSHGKEYWIYPFQILYIQLTHSKRKKANKFHIVIDRFSVEKKYFEGEICFLIQDQPNGESTVQGLMNLFEQCYGCKLTTKEQL